jgi:hypothetical protein
MRAVPTTIAASEDARAKRRTSPLDDRSRYSYRRRDGRRSQVSPRYSCFFLCVKLEARYLCGTFLPRPAPLTVESNTPTRRRTISRGDHRVGVVPLWSVQ